MNRGRNIALAGIFMILALIVGCAGSYGTMRVEDKGVMTVDTLVSNSQNYDIYYAGDGSIAVAVVFDPKADGKTLKMGSRWDRMPDQTSLTRMVGYIKQQSPRSVYGPTLYAILGPDGSTYGYVYTMLDHLVINVIDNNTMLVESLS